MTCSLAPRILPPRRGLGTRLHDMLLLTELFCTRMYQYPTGYTPTTTTADWAIINTFYTTYNEIKPKINYVLDHWLHVTKLTLKLNIIKNFSICSIFLASFPHSFLSLSKWWETRWEPGNEDYPVSMSFFKNKRFPTKSLHCVEDTVPQPTDRQKHPVSPHWKLQLHTWGSKIKGHRSHLIVSHVKMYYLMCAANISS